MVRLVEATHAPTVLYVYPRTGVTGVEMPEGWDAKPGAPVSSDGALMAMSDSLDHDGAEQLAAIVSGLVSLGQGASTCFRFGGLQQVIIAMHGGYAFVSAISDGSCLGVVASTNCDIGQIGYQCGLLVDRAGAVLTPAPLRTEAAMTSVASTWTAARAARRRPPRRTDSAKDVLLLLLEKLSRRTRAVAASADA